MIGRLVRLNVGVALGGRRVLWLVGGLIVLWVFSFHLLNPWDIVNAAVSPNTITFITVPLYLVILNADLLQPWQTLTVIRAHAPRAWWLAHVAAAGTVALLLGVGLAVLTVLAPLAAHRWSWAWGTYGLNSATPAVLALPPWTVPWHWGLEALGYLVLGLWAVGVLRHVLALWWRGPWIALLAVVSLGFVSRSLVYVDRAAVWWLPGTQFSFSFHWSATGPVRLGWTVGYTVALLAVAAAVGLVLAQHPRWRSLHGGAL